MGERINIKIPWSAQYGHYIELETQNNWKITEINHGKGREKGWVRTFRKFYDVIQLKIF